LGKIQGNPCSNWKNEVLQVLATTLLASFDFVAVIPVNRNIIGGSSKVVEEERRNIVGGSSKAVEEP
jgi:hypothetical protein